MAQSKIQRRLATPPDQRKPVLSATPKAGTFAEDYKVPENKFWDESESHYQTVLGAVEKTHGELAAHLSNIVNDDKLYEAVKDNKGLLENIQLLSRDIQEHVNRIESIHDLHKHRKGGTKTPDDHAQLIQIHGQYFDAEQIYQANMLPTVTHIFEQIGVAEKALETERQTKLLEEEQKAQAQDPSVVSDVQVKTPDATQ